MDNVKKKLRGIILKENLLSFADKVGASCQDVAILKDYVDGATIKSLSKKYNISQYKTDKMVLNYVKKCHCYMRYGLCQVTTQTLNNASAITLISELVSVKIDKSGTVTEIANGEIVKDITENLMNYDDDNSSEVYTLGLVIKMLLTNNASDECISYMNLFDKVIIE